MPGGTSKQREFARLVAEGSTLADAYAEAYETSGKRETIRREASRLARSPNVAPMIEAEGKAIESAQLPTRATRRRFVLERLVRESETAPSDSARIRALELLPEPIAVTPESETPEDEGGDPL